MREREKLFHVVVLLLELSFFGDLWWIILILKSDTYGSRNFNHIYLSAALANPVVMQRRRGGGGLTIFIRVVKSVVPWLRETSLMSMFTREPSLPYWIFNILFNELRTFDFCRKFPISHGMDGHMWVGRGERRRNLKHKFPLNLIMVLELIKKWKGADRDRGLSHHHHHQERRPD